MSRVWDDAPYSLGTLLVLLALADWADDDGICWPKISQLEVKTRQSERSVQYALAQLLKDGAISVLKKSTGSGKARTLQLGVQYLHPSKVQNLHPKSAKSAPAIRKEEFRHKEVRHKPPTPFFPNSKTEGPDQNLTCSNCGKSGAFPVGGGPLCPKCIGRAKPRKAH